VYISPLKQDADAQFSKRITIGANIGQAMQEAVQGEQGSGEFIDYLGNRAIGAWQYLSSLNCGLVAKIDEGEAFEEALNLRNTMAVILLIVFVLCCITAFTIAQSISQPIKGLVRSAEIIGSGNLDHKIEIKQNDEIGLLSKAFNTMTMDLKNITASRDDLNREIHDRKQAEEALRETRDYLEKLINYANAPIICWDASFKITRFNHAFEKLTGYKAQEIIGRELIILFPAERRQDILANIAATLSGNYWEAVEIPILCKSDNIRTVLWNSANIYGKDSKTLRATIAQGHDITERKIAEEALFNAQSNLELKVSLRTAELRESNELLEHIFSTTHMSIVYLDSSFIRVNKSYADIEGYSPDYYVGKNHFELYPHNENKRIFQNVVDTGEPFAVYTKPFIFPKHPEWGVTYWDWSLYPVKDQWGKIEGLIFSLINVTKRKTAEDDLLDMQNKLNETKRLSDVGTLAATVAHELRNPLAAIKMAAYNIKRKAQNPMLDKHIANIEVKLSESEQIIDNLLFFSRLKMPKLDIINIYPILEDIISSVIERFSSSGVLINKNIDSLKDVLIEADEVQMKELFINLINNAADALTNHTGSITIEGEKKDNAAIVHIKDNGSGIETDDLDRVFDPFFTTKAKGTGLGLSVCNQIVHLHGGSITIESKKNIGTTVRVQLPLRQEQHGKKDINS
jgi:PAS domain S-box-containing protein